MGIMTVFPFRRPHVGLSIGAGMLGLAEVRRDWRQGRGRRIQQQLAEVWARLPIRKDFPELILAVSDMARKDRLAIPGMNYKFDEVEGDLS